MSITRLKRKQRKDVNRTKSEQMATKLQNFKPVVKNVDIEKIKEEFRAKAGKKA